MQTTTLLVVAFASLVIAKSDLEISKEHLAEVKEFAKAPPTFHDALEKATHEKKPEKLEKPKEEPEKPDFKKPDDSKNPELKNPELKNPELKKKIYFEIIRVNERVVVDEHNTAKGYTANMHNALYSLESGHLRRLYFTDMVVKPKPGSPLLKAIQIQHKEGGEIPDGPSKPPKKGMNFRKLFNKIAKKLRLDQFWPRVLVATILSFISTVIIYVGLWFLFSAYYSLRGYNETSDEERQFSNTSEERLLKYEHKQMAEAKPIIPNV